MTYHAFIVYKVKIIWVFTLFSASHGLTFAASLPDRQSAEDWIVHNGSRKVNYTILEVFRK